MSEIPWIVGAARKTIVGFIGHEEFGCIGCADDDGACGAQALDDRSGARRDFVSAEERSSGVGPAGDVEAAFDGDGNSVKRAEWLIASELFGCCASSGAGGGGIEMDEGVEFWLERSDASEMRFEEFGRRELFCPKESGDFSDGREMERGHKEF